MPSSIPDSDRLQELLNDQVEKGFSQQQIAARAGLPAQYLSDLKNGRRPLTELTARRLGGEFGVNFEWLLGRSPLKEIPSMSSEDARSTAETDGVPCFAKPIEGDPWKHPDWDGRIVILAGAAAARAATALQPYAIQFGRNDLRGRLCKGDFVLISQEKNSNAEMCVVKLGSKLYLARRRDGEWERLNGEKTPATCAVAGHCLGIIWASL